VPAPPVPRGAALALLMAGLLGSGVAGVVNQVVWQRALRVYLGGSETLSAMVVVVVFLAGLGLGAELGGRAASRGPRPLRALAGVELALAVVNLCVAGALAADLSETVYAVQRLAQGAGVPLRAVYALGAGLLLLPPTLLMGATMPLAAASCQRSLGLREDALVPVLLFVNTVGAAAGALGASLWLVPWMGQRAALYAALSLNAFAGLLFAVAAARRPASPAPGPAAGLRTSAPSPGLTGTSTDVWAGGALGVLALSYEMLLIRALTLSHEPLPATFAAALAGYLGWWSIGAAAAGRLPLRLLPVAALTALSVGLLPPVHHAIRAGGLLGLLPAAALYTLPCVGFGLLYGGLARRLAGAGDWGGGLGRFSAVNTLGSCAGVLGFTLIGFEAPLAHGAAFIAVGVLAVGLAAWRPAPGATAGLVAAGALAWGVTIPTTTAFDGEVAWWGRDGVVELTPDGDIYIDGLWHTRLSDGQDHIGQPYSWVMAAAAVLARGDRPLDRALVIGAGIGISGVTLAGVEGLQVDGYEINQTLRRLIEAHPEGTLHALTHPSLRWIWMDARTGLALDPQRYDVILSAPLHLRAAGSTSLLSGEYLKLVKSRLTDGGVLAVYANEGDEAQRLLIQRTLADTFRHRASWADGIVTIASDAPLVLSEDALIARMQRDDRFAAELRRWDAGLRAEGGGGAWAAWDGPDATALVADRALTDDHPLLESPKVAAALVRPVPAPAR